MTLYFENAQSLSITVIETINNTIFLYCIGSRCLGLISARNPVSSNVGALQWATVPHPWVMKDDSSKHPYCQYHCMLGSENKLLNLQSYGLLVKRSKILYNFQNYDMRKGGDSLFWIPGGCGIQREVRMGLSEFGTGSSCWNFHLRPQPV